MPRIFSRRIASLFLMLLSGLLPAAPASELAFFERLGWQSSADAGYMSRRLSDDLADGSCGDFSLLEAALVAGGVDDAGQLAQLVADFESRVERDGERIRAAKDNVERANRLLDCLHQQLLTGEYRRDYSQPHRTLAEGHFNCLTATILFRALCDRFQVPVSAVASRRHVLCELRDPQRLIETTSRSWRLTDSVDLGPFLESAGESPAVRPLSDVQLIGKVYYNAGVAYLEAQQFALAARALTTACRLDPEDLAARDNWAAAFNNWALAECDAGHFELAVELILAGLSVHPDHLALLANDLHVHQQWVQRLCRRGDYQLAAEVLERASRRRPTAAWFEQGRRVVQERLAQVQLDALSETSAGAPHESK